MPLDISQNASAVSKVQISDVPSPHSALRSHNLPVARCKDTQANKGISRFHALVLIGTTAALCAAFTPHMTKPIVASKRSETAQPDVCPPNWLPVLLATHPSHIDSPSPRFDEEFFSFEHESEMLSVKRRMTNMEDDEYGSGTDCVESFCSPPSPPQCAPNCPPLWITDGICENSCNVPDCNYDGGDCILSQGPASVPLWGVLLLALGLSAVFVVPLVLGYRRVSQGPAPVPRWGVVLLVLVLSAVFVVLLVLGYRGDGYRDHLQKQKVQKVSVPLWGVLLLVLALSAVFVVLLVLGYRRVSQRGRYRSPFGGCCS